MINGIHGSIGVESKHLDSQLSCQEPNGIEKSVQRTLDPILISEVAMLMGLPYRVENKDGDVVELSSEALAMAHAVQPVESCGTENNYDPQRRQNQKRHYIDVLA